jgi:hypothetical protein
MNVAVVCRKKAFDETRRKIGWFSYPVPDLEWTFYPVEDDLPVNKNKLADKGHDVIFWEDWVWNTWVGDASIPIYAAIVDSNTSPRRRKRYVERAKLADVLLIDQDKLTPFGKTGKKAFRWQYAVNEFVFAPRQKTVDVGYHVARTPARAALGPVIKQHCAMMQHSLTMGGGKTIDQYANLIGSARIVVHKATHEQCRSHRFFDALASGSCLLTERVWTVNEDQFHPGSHYAEWSDPDHLQKQITDLLQSGQWSQIAEAGRAHVIRLHTWRTRAEQLHKIIEGTYARA